MSSVALYSYFRSSSSFRVRIALNLKDIEYEIKPIHLLKDGGQQKKDNYKKFNPMGEVPCLVHDGKYLAQSMAIIEYIDGNFPGHALFPAIPYDAALVRQICEIVNSGIQPIQNLKVLQKIEKDFGADQDTKNKWAHYWIQEGFVALEKILESLAGSYSYKNKLSAADCFVIPQVFNAKRFSVDMKQFPTIQRIFDSCMNVPAFERAAPENQPDFEK
ncbi:MAG: hypothetical protein A4S09_01940 [Proteobacteria bacterium SG_bin7]|nr:MAG: hypothetical protein A4S09_01940 [Proteobacteria bacterium SG_bin7]